MENLHKLFVKRRILLQCENNHSNRHKIARINKQIEREIKKYSKKQSKKVYQESVKLLHSVFDNSSK